MQTTYWSVAWHSIFSQKDKRTLQTASSFLKGRGERNTSIPVRSAVGQYQRNTSRCVVNFFLVASASKPSTVTDRRVARCPNFSVFWSGPIVTRIFSGGKPSP